MQLTSPLFLFLFLPLSLPAVILVPRAGRNTVLSALSLVFLVLANRAAPWGLLQMGLTVLLLLLLFFLSPRATAPRTKRLFLVLEVTLPLLSLLSARLFALLIPAYSYPFGLLFITLAAISLSIDRARGDGDPSAAPTDLIAYLLFFPTLTMGPLIRYKHFCRLSRHARPSSPLFCRGILLFALGYVKRIAVAAVLLRALDALLDAHAAMPLLALPVLLLIAFLLLYFFVSGSADMARGVAAMYGMSLPRDRKNLLYATTPHDLLHGLFHSFFAYGNDYLIAPLVRRLGDRRGRLLGEALLLLLTVLVFALSPAVLLALIPLYLSFAFTVRYGKRKKPLSLPVQVLFFLLSLLACSPAALLVSAGDPRRVSTLLSSLFDGTPARLYSFYFAVSDMQYILAVVALFLFVLPVLALVRRIRPSEGVRLALFVLSSLLLLAAFLLTLLYLMPQFPQYAATPYGSWRFWGVKP